MGHASLEGPRMRLARPLLRGMLLLAATVAALGAVPAMSLAQACDPAVNEIVCENAKPGAPEWTWRIQGYGDPTLQGFATSMSVDKGQRISFKIKSETPDYSI